MNCRMSLRFLVGPVASLILLALVGTAPSAALVPDREAAPVGPRSLGVPLRDVLLIGGTVGTMADGRRVIWSVSSGTPAYLNAIDPVTGAPVQTYALEGASGAYGVEQAPDGTVYVGTYGDGRLYRLASGASAVEDLGVPIASETYVWSIVVSPDGTVFGGTSPGGKVFSWNPTTRQFRDFGAVAPGQTYVKSVAFANGKVYAGAYSSWVITELDPVSGATRSLPLPPGMTDPTGKVVYDLRAYGGRLYARLGTFPGPLYVMDLASGAWTDTIEGAAGLDVTPPGPDGRVWFFRQFEVGSSELIGYDPVTKAQERTGLRTYGRIVNTRGIGWAPLGIDGYPGQSIVGLFWRGQMFRYSPETKQSGRLPTSVRGEPTPVLALESGQPGTVYAGGFLQGGLATVDTKTGATAYNRFSQVEKLLFTDNGLYIGAYPDARVYRFEPTKPWYSSEYTSEPPSGQNNPVKLLDLKPLTQSRLQGMTEASGKIVVGSTPSGDTLGGALGVIDKATGAVDIVVPDPIQDEAIVSLTAYNGVVYGSTSVAGGLSTTVPTQAQATIFAWDIQRRQLLWEVNPSTSAKIIPAVQSDAYGHLWAVVDGDLLQIDPRTGRTIRTLDTTPGVASSGQLALDDKGKTLYALLGGSRVVIVNTASAKWRHLLDQQALRMVWNDGELIFSNGPELVAWKVPAATSVVSAVP